MVNNLTLKQLLTFAADTKASENVRGIALLQVDELKMWMNRAIVLSATEQKANLLFGLSQIKEFENNPDKFKPAETLNMPDGSPIGMEEY